MQTFVTHLECSLTGERYQADRVHGLSASGKPLLVRYDLDAMAEVLEREEVSRREGGFWRYREFLPVRFDANVVALGEVTTPLIRLPAPHPRCRW